MPRVQFIPQADDDSSEAQKVFSKDQELLSHLLDKCTVANKDSSASLRQMKYMLSEATEAESKFNLVFNILNELEGVDARAIEQLFYYKVNGLQEFELEAKEVTRYHKFAQLEGSGANTKILIQQDAIRRRQLLDKIK